MNAQKVADALVAACDAHPDERAVQVWTSALGTNPSHLTDVQAEARLWAYAVRDESEEAA